MADTTNSQRRPLVTPARVCLLGAMIAAAMTLHGAEVRVGWQDIVIASWSPDPSDVRQILFHFSYLPRVSVSIIAGAMLALAGLLCQEILRNPLAEPTTLGIATEATGKLADGASASENETSHRIYCRLLQAETAARLGYTERAKMLLKRAAESASARNLPATQQSWVKAEVGRVGNLIS